MKRLTSYAFNDAIQGAMAHMPLGIAWRLANVDYCCGVDPVFVGLHRYRDTDDGRPYSQTAHAVWMVHQEHRPMALRVPTVVLPLLAAPETVAHELGHILHEAIGFGPSMTPVTEYAKTNKWEAFAEAFTAWLGWYGEDIRASVAEKDAALFAGLT